MKRWATLALLAIAPDPAVYTCRVAVTGHDARNRPDAVEACGRQVLVKLSGEPGLADIAAPGTSVTDFAYLDRMTDIPLHDEQGTRDRPFDFVGHVDPGWAGAALRQAGVAPWTAPRPLLRVQVEVTDMRGDHFDLTGDGERGERQRRALLDAAELFALPVSLPAEDAPPAPPPSPVLTGVLRWSDADFGWVAVWRMGDARWEVRGVSFDVTFRSGVGGAARLLAAGGMGR